MQFIPHSLSPANILWQYRVLLLTLIHREVLGRYKGSLLGVAWSFLQPIMMLAVYTFVFSVVFKARWHAMDDGSQSTFALNLFAGLISFTLFSDSLNRATTTIIHNPNFVKKIQFPLEILPLVPIGAALIHFLISLIILLVFSLFVTGTIHASALSVPIVVLPLLLITAGASWIMASLTVYIRDIAHVIGMATNVLLFMTPIFYPVTALPPHFRTWLELNPLTGIIEQTRQVLIIGNTLDWSLWSKQMALGILIATLGLIWFQKTRKGFADVL